ncbi:hypothetical protein [Sphingomonas paeninsulae]
MSASNPLSQKTVIALNREITAMLVVSQLPEHHRQTFIITSSVTRLIFP